MSGLIYPGSVLEEFVAHYKVTGKLGVGGMGEVYRATDTKLNREVAIKVLPATFRNDAERLARLQREAQVLATLYHPNIAAIHGIEETKGSVALVLELVEGETLEDRIRHGNLPIEEALELCAQIAEALESAHERGIIHRDLKPGNVKITPDGKAKVLDFGLAKSVAQDLNGNDSSNSASPTLSGNFTRHGVILGTAAYMSPEQARGKPVDRRSDIWSFGCLLFECLTGKRLFQGTDFSETLAKIIQGVPEFSALPKETPPIVGLLLHRCLIKNRDSRLQHIGDARVDLEQAIRDPSSSSLTQILKPFRDDTRDRDRKDFVLQRYAIPLHPRSHLMTAHHGSSIEVAPDCSRLAYCGLHEGLEQVFWKGINHHSFKAIPQSKDTYPPLIFSPGADQLAFSSGNWLKIFSFQGGLPRAVAEVGRITGGFWPRNDQIIFTSSQGLFSVNPLTKNSPKQILAVDSDRGEVLFSHPRPLVGDQRILIGVLNRDEIRRVEVVDLSSLKRYPLDLQGGSITMYHQASGHLVYGRDDVLWARPFNPHTLEFLGPEISMVDEVGRDWSCLTHQFSLAKNGTLLFVRGRSTEPEHELVLIDSNDKPQVVPLDPGDYQLPRVAPDGQTVLLQAGKRGALIVDLKSGMTSVMEIPFEAYFPIEFDGESLYYTTGSVEDDRRTVYRKEIGASGPGEIILEPSMPRAGAQAISASRKSFVILEVTPNQNHNLWIQDLPASNPARPFLNSSLDQFGAKFSPNDRWIAYSSAESGNHEIYVRNSSGVGLAIKVSQNGGTLPAWSPDGNRLYYRGPDKRTIMVAALVSEEPLSFEKPVIFTSQSFRTAGIENGASYDVVSGGCGDQILLLKAVHEELQSEAATHFGVLVHFDMEMTRLTAGSSSPNSELNSGRTSYRPQ